jgi:DNA-binding MarR family transcriptional regulator
MAAESGMTLDPFTPWQESGEVLLARTVALDEALRWLVSACKAFLEDKRPTWCLVVGPRGSGKSHLLQLARTQLSDPDVVTWVGEDTAGGTDADALWNRIWNPEDPWGWAPPAKRAERRILFVEGLDRLLGGLKPEGRWAFRHHLQESGAFLVGTALGAEIAAQSGEAFFGQLDTWGLEPLSLEAARELFLRVSGEAERAPVALTLTRREALLRMSGGSPRAIMVLAEAVQGTEGDALGAAEGLLQAVQRLVTHYQQRFHDLPPLGQQILEVLARAPRELTAREVQQHTGASSAAVSMTARTLESAGILHRQPDEADARVSRYSLAEPLFRYWLEYRTMPSWESTRSAWLGKLLGEVLTREELADVWWSAPPGHIRESIQATAREELENRAWVKLLEAKDAEQQEHALQRALHLGLSPEMRQLFIWRLLSQGRRDLLAQLESWRDDPASVALLDLAVGLQERRAKAAFVKALRALNGLAWSPLLMVVNDSVRLLLNAMEPRGGPWKPLSPGDQELLASIPFLRARFAIEGRRITDPPLLEWERLLKLPIGMATLDLDALLAAAHQRQDAPFFARVASSMLESNDELPQCPRPELLAPAPALLVPLLCRPSPAALTWVASLAALSDSAAAEVIDALDGHPSISTPEEISALLALGVRSPERFEALARALGDHASVTEARRTLRQLNERAHGRLQPELEEVWKAVAPKPHFV